jgi:hypothetical protein
MYISHINKTPEHLYANSDDYAAGYLLKTNATNARRDATAVSKHPSSQNQVYRAR